MARVFGSSRSVANSLIVLGALACGHWIYWLIAPATGWDVTDSMAGASVFLFAPTALAGAAVLTGGTLMMRSRQAGRAIASVGLGLALLYAVYWGVAVLASLGDCSALARGCDREWTQIAWTAVALIVTVCLLVAVWRARGPART